MNKYDGIDGNVVANIQKFARRLKQVLSIELDDIEQELMCRFLMIKGKFDPQKGTFLTFINAVLHKISMDLIREQIRDKRVIRFWSVPYVDQQHGLSGTAQLNDLTPLVCKLPSKYRLIFRLLQHDCVAEIARKMHLSRACIHYHMKLLADYLLRSSNLENNGLALEFGSKFKMKNLSVIETLDAKQLSELAAHDLADLSDQVAKLVSHTKDLKAKLEDALNLRFSETIKENLRRENKDTGTVKFDENGFQIIAEVPKKITWDAEQMEEIIKTIPEDKRKSIVKTTYTIDERRYAQLSYEYQQLFNPARTVTPGKTRLQITLSLLRNGSERKGA